MVAAGPRRGTSAVGTFNGTVLTVPSAWEVGSTC